MEIRKFMRQHETDREHILGAWKALGLKALFCCLRAGRWWARHSASLGLLSLLSVKQWSRAVRIHERSVPKGTVPAHPRPSSLHRVASELAQHPAFDFTQGACCEAELQMGCLRGQAGKNGLSRFRVLLGAEDKATVCNLKIHTQVPGAKDDPSSGTSSVWGWPSHLECCLKAVLYPVSTHRAH